MTFRVAPQQAERPPQDPVIPRLPGEHPCPKVERIVLEPAQRMYVRAVLHLASAFTVISSGHLAPPDSVFDPVWRHAAAYVTTHRQQLPALQEVRVAALEWPVDRCVQYNACSLDSHSDMILAFLADRDGIRAGWFGTAPATAVKLAALGVALADLSGRRWTRVKLLS